MSLFQFIKSKIFLKQIAIAIISLLLVSFLFLKWLNISTNHNQKIEVPNISKLSIKKAQSLLKEADLVLKVIDSANFNPNYPPNSIIEQDPEAGDFVKQNRKIYVTLNPSSYRSIEIPYKAVLRKTKRNATAILRSAGFRIGSTPIYVNDIAKDIVRGVLHNGKRVKSGNNLPKNSILNLVLGDGKGN